MKERHFKTIIKHHMDPCQWTDIESSINSGFPDAVVSKNFKTRLFEFKIPKGRYMYFEKSQMVWFHDANLRGAPAYVLFPLSNDSVGVITPQSLTASYCNKYSEPYRNKVRILLEHLIHDKVAYNYLQVYFFFED